MKIYVSTICFNQLPLQEIVDLAERESFHLEFSSGVPYTPDAVQIFEAANLDKIMHNYFPAPESPFVLNLASTIDKVQSMSSKHCINAINNSAKNGSGFFAAHAGFCLDPDPKELGVKINAEGNAPREEYKKNFITSVKDITKHAKSKNIKFLIENNVLAPFNYNNGHNPFLCCDADEMMWLFDNQPKDNHFGLLLDTAHLKVSCQTLGLDLDQEIEKITPFIDAIHHSDNDGTADTNRQIKEDYWFLPYMKEFKNIPHVLEVKNQTIDEVRMQINLLEKHGN